MRHMCHYSCITIIASLLFTYSVDEQGARLQPPNREKHTVTARATDLELPLPRPTSRERPIRASVITEHIRSSWYPTCGKTLNDPPRDENMTYPTYTF